MRKASKYQCSLVCLLLLLFVVCLLFVYCLLLLGFVGVTVLLVITPLVAFWDFIKWEEFELPPNNMIWTLLLINGFIGTVLSELLWLWYFIIMKYIYTINIIF